MPNYLTNQLLFLSNAKYILDLVKKREPGGTAPALLSLQSIKPMPESLALPLTRHIRMLALMNMAPPQFASSEVEMVAAAQIFRGKAGASSPSQIDAAIESVRARLAVGDARRRPDHTDLGLLEQAVANYRQHRCFCYYDWRWTHWGTVEDIHSVVPSTFEPPTTTIEFTTRWTPPIGAMEALAQMFPSVRFELRYRFRRRDAWTAMEIFPLTPFGY